MRTRRRSERRDALLSGLGVVCVLVVGLALGCQSVRVHTDYDRSASFAGLKTFAWLEPPETEGVDPFADNTLLRKRVHAAIEFGLGARGFKPVEEGAEPDFLATYAVVLDQRIRDDGSVSVGYGGYRGYGYGYGGIYSAPSVRSYQESTLIIDILDPSTKDLLWRGWAAGIIPTRDRERSDERLRKGVRRILERFPPVLEGEAPPTP